MQAALTRQFPEAKVTLIEGSGGVFDVRRDNQLIFSRDRTGRFPEEEEIIGIISDTKQ